MSTLLVIGGSGFFGKSILDYFQRSGLSKWGVDRVIAMSRNVERLNSEYPQLISSRVKLVTGDIANIDSLPEADIVIHAATSTDALSYFTNKQIETDNIEQGTTNYCNLAPRYHYASKILYVSSGAVYGAQPEGLTHISEDLLPFNLDALIEGKRDYANGKIKSEEAIINLGEQGMSVSIARCFSFVGSWLPRDQHFAIGNFIQDGLSGRPIKVNACKRVYRSYMYADDLVEWLLSIATHANPACPVYNVGSDVEIEIRELAAMIAEHYGVPIDLQEITDQSIDRYVPSVEKAYREVDLKVTYNLKKCIVMAISEINNRRLNISNY